MNLSIEEKLNLTQTPICFFKEGIFLKLLNQSFYVVQQHYLPNLKCQVKYIKKINQTIVVGGFPLSSIMAKFPNAIPTKFGYQLFGDYDLSGYQTWFTNCCQHDKQPSKESRAIDLYTNTHIHPDIALLKQDNAQSNYLTQQQLAFLQHWQPNLYPHSVEIAFINELKMHFLSLKDK